MPIEIKRLHDNAYVPTRGSKYAAGIDLYSDKDVDIPPGKRALIPTGISMKIPEGTVGLIWPRSKLASKMGLQSGAGVVDSDYRGEVHVLLFNLSDQTQEIRVGDRIAQILIQQVDMSIPIQVSSLDDTDRGSSGITDSELRLR